MFEVENIKAWHLRRFESNPYCKYVLFDLEKIEKQLDKINELLK